MNAKAWLYLLLAFAILVDASITSFLVYELVEANGKLSEAERLQFLLLIAGGLGLLWKITEKLVELIKEERER